MSTIMDLATADVQGENTPTHLQRVRSRAKGSLVGLFSSDDYPNEALRKGETGTVSVQLTVGTDGRVKECRVRLSSASPSLDASTCRILADRAKFDPALDRAGQPVTDRYSQRITWKIPKPDGEPVGGAKAQILVVEHADGRLDCTMWGENLAVSDPEVCQQWRKWAKDSLAQLPNPLSAPYRATLTFETLLGEGIPIATNPEMTIRGAARLWIDQAGRVTSCQPLADASLNGDDAIDLCSRADERRFVTLPATAKDRGDRQMVTIRSISFEAGEPSTTK